MKYFYMLAYIFVSFLFISCKKNYVDEKTREHIKNVEKCQSSLSKAYKEGVKLGYCDSNPCGGWDSPHRECIIKHPNPEKCAKIKEKTVKECESLGVTVKSIKSSAS